MKKFKAQTGFPALRVDRDLVSSLEHVFQIDARSYWYAEDGEDCDAKFTISITDDVGTAVIETMSEYRPSLFAESVSNITIEFSTPYGVEPWIWAVIEFTENEISSKVSIHVEGEHSREIAMGLHNQVDNLMQSKKSLHGALFKAPFKYDFLLGAVTGLPLWFVLLREEIGAGLVSIGIIGLLSGVALIAGILKHFVFGYTLFDTRRTRRRVAVVKWVLLGILSFLIFGTIVAGLRDLILNSS